MERGGFKPSTPSLHTPTGQAQRFPVPLRVEGADDQFQAHPVLVVGGRRRLVSVVDTWSVQWPQGQPSESHRHTLKGDPPARGDVPEEQLWIKHKV